jgi:hypothetical protein
VSKEPHQAAQEKEAKMYRSTYLSWFRRLLILGAVVAGLTASAAGARLDPGTPPDVRDVASALSTTPATIVSRPPDVLDAATSVNAAAPDVFEREAAAHPYGRGLAPATSPIDRIIAQEQGRQHDLALFSLGFSAPTTSSDFLSTPPDVQDAMTALHSTPEGLKADSLRWQGIARTYSQLQSPDTASQSTSPIWEHQLHSPVTASQYPTPAGLKADGLRYQGIAQVYEQLQSDKAPVSGGSDFAWGDWAIGVGAGIGMALLLGIGLMVGRQQRHRVQPA